MRQVLSVQALGICTWLCAKTCSNRLVWGCAAGAGAGAAREAGPRSPASPKLAAPILSRRLSRLFRLLSGSACAACCCSGF